MRWLLFLSRVAFICGFSFLLAFATLFFKQVDDNEWLKTLIIIGFVIGAVVLPLSLFCYLMLSLIGKKPGTVVPKWIVIANILFLFVLLSYIFYLNDPYYFKR
jgi:uncharacterized membrane-anchored protein